MSEPIRVRGQCVWVSAKNNKIYTSGDAEISLKLEDLSHQLFENLSYSDFRNLLAELQKYEVQKYEVKDKPKEQEYCMYVDREDCPVHKSYLEPQFNPCSMDAVVWAKEFMRVYREQTLKGIVLWIKEDLMVAWFANAIMAGYDEAKRRYEHKPLTESIPVKPITPIITEGITTIEFLEMKYKVNEIIEYVNQHKTAEK